MAIQVQANPLCNGQDATLFLSASNGEKENNIYIELCARDSRTPFLPGVPHPDTTLSHLLVLLLNITHSSVSFCESLL